MGSRGRTSAAHLSVVTTGAVEKIDRPKAPDDLTDEQSEEWRAVVERLPADWFPRETWALLAQYCRHVVTSRRVQKIIEALESEKEFDVDAYDKALKMQERESRCIASLATRMRLTQQTTYDKKRNKGNGGNRKPWNDV